MLFHALVSGIALPETVCAGLFDPLPLALGRSDADSERKPGEDVSDDSQPSSLPSLILPSFSSLTDALSSSCKAARRDGASVPVLPAVLTVFVLTMSVTFPPTLSRSQNPPFLSQRKLEHLDPSEKIDLEVLGASSLTLQQCYSRLEISQTVW